MPEGLDFTIDGPVARITLDRPEVGNAMDRPMTRALMEVAIECDENRQIRCVVIAGRGRMFCAGGDVAGFKAAGDRLPSYVKDITGYLHLAVARLSRMEKPLLTVVNGAAAGAGFSLAVLGDIVLCSSNATFTLAYPAIGLTPDGGMTWLLPRLVGLRKAQEMMLLNRRITAGEALAMGLVTRVVDDAGLHDEASTVAQKLASSATSALGSARKLLIQSSTTSLETQLEHESRSIAAQASTAEGREGIAAFLEKRSPHFMNRV
jgi:2-(1,2-epoxy-1,2-dihydrophenyl)acetyl-CoA isomerase